MDFAINEMQSSAMKVLFSSTAGDGHFYPLVPLAHALKAQGHDVAFAMASGYAARVQEGGFTWMAAGIEQDELDRRWFGHVDELVSLPLAAQLPFAIARRFAEGDAPDRVADLLAVTQDWCPDLLIFEPCDFAAPIAATACGVPFALHSFGRALPPESYETSRPYVEGLWREAGLEAPELCGMYDGRYLDICPPSLQGVGPPTWARVMPLRPSLPPAVTDEPAWLDGLPRQRTVYVTLGTMWNDVGRFRLVLDAVDGIECNVLLTIGRDNDVRELGALPPNARVEQFVPQGQVLPYVDAVLAHGGSGSMLAALAHGRPMVLLPRGADQFENAQACELAGVARVLMPAAVSADALRVELEALLEDDRYSTRAAEIAHDIDQMPDPAAVATALAEAVEGSRS